MRLRGKKSEFLTISEALKSEGEKTQPCGLRKHNQEILAHEVGGEKSSEIRKECHYASMSRRTVLQLIFLAAYFTPSEAAVVSAHEYWRMYSPRQADAASGLPSR